MLGLIVRFIVSAIVLMLGFYCLALPVWALLFP